MDGEVPVETNVTFYRMISCLVLLILVGTGAMLVKESHSLAASLVIVAMFSFIGLLSNLVIRMACTDFSQDYFDELHRRGD